MIKDSCYIRKFTTLQRQKLQAIATEHNMKTTTDILLFAVEQYQEQKEEVARLKRLIAYKQKKIELLTNYNQ